MRRAAGAGGVERHGLGPPAPADRGRAVGEGCATRRENEGADEHDDRAAEAAEAAISGPDVLGPPRVGAIVAEARLGGRHESARSPRLSRAAAEVAWLAHDDCPDSVRVTVKVTPWHELGALAASSTNPGMDWLPLVLPGLTAIAGEKV
jgi:hypothetical protein